MRKTQTMIALIAILAMMMGLLVALPASAGAATGMATIDVNTLGATSLDNSASVATESQWVYDAATRYLRFYSEDGNYTLQGTNTNLTIQNANVSNVTFLFNNLNVSCPSNWAFVSTKSCAITLSGTSTLTSGFSSGAGLCLQGSDTTTTINGSGTLQSYGQGAGGIFFTENVTLILDGDATVVAQGDRSINLAPGYTILIGDEAMLECVNLDYPTEFTVTALNPASSSQWKLAGDATTTDALTAASIVVSIPGDATGTIAREVIVEEPSLTPTLSDATLHFLYPQIGTTRQVTVTQLLDGTTPLGDWDWEIIGNTNPAVATVVDPTSGAYDDPLTIEALAPGQTVITVKVMEFANGLTGRYGLATITVTVDGPPPTDNGGDKVPPTGDALTLLSPMMLATLSLLSICTAIIDKKRG